MCKVGGLPTTITGFIFVQRRLEIVASSDCSSSVIGSISVLNDSQSYHCSDSVFTHFNPY